MNGQLTTADIATLWLQLTEIYSSRFVNCYGESDSGVWYQALADLHFESISHGLQAMLRDERFETWPPNCTQFRKLCLSHAGYNVLPTVHKAWHEAHSNMKSRYPIWSHAAVKFTVKCLSVDALVAARTDIAFAKFQHIYERVCKHVQQGQIVPEVNDCDVQLKKPCRSKLPRLAYILRNLP